MIEIMIAFAIMTVVLLSAIAGNAATQYWRITADASRAALDVARAEMNTMRALASRRFYEVTALPPHRMSDDGCAAGGLCYFSETSVDDYSSCKKAVTIRVSWQTGQYPTSTIRLFTTLSNVQEAIALGGDCQIEKPNDWTMIHAYTHTDRTLGEIRDIDVFAGNAYIVDDRSPYLHIIGTDDSCHTCTDAYNALDVARDLRTGRTYAYAAVATTTQQLHVIDVTDPHQVVVVATRALNGATGSYPQGWRVRVYGDRLYILTRETAGPELHIFNIADPTQPAEVGSGLNLGRTVTDLIVRDQMIDGVMHRFLFLAAKAGLKELSVLDVTGDTMREIDIFDAPGSADATSIALSGNHLYLGRDNVTGGPELYVFDMTDPTLDLAQRVIATAEVGARITSMRAWGTYLFLNVAKSGKELQVWSIASSSPILLKTVSAPHLVERGLEIDGALLYTVLQGTPVSLQTWYAP